MKSRIHAGAGGLGFAIILMFWTSTVISELFCSLATIIMVKNMIVWGLLILIPAMAVVGGSGLSLGQGRKDARIQAKKKRMPFIAGNGFMVLIPCALFLSNKARAGSFDEVFYAVQGLELIAGAVNLMLMGLNIRDGLMMTGRISESDFRVKK